MIVEKNPKNQIQATPIDDPFIEPEVNETEGNPLGDIFKAVRQIIKDIKKDPNDPNSPPLFKTVKINYGQLSRIKHDKHNYETAISFPAAFINFINVRWLVQTARIGEGRAELRICFVLNRLNPEDDEFQTEGFEVFQRINHAMNQSRSSLPSFTDRMQLTFFDQVENYDDSLQQYWITYEVWFKDYTDYEYKNYVERRLVIPPFTNHSDQDNNDYELLEHGNHKDPTFDEVSSFGDAEEQPNDI